MHTFLGYITRIGVTQTLGMYAYGMVYVIPYITMVNTTI